MHAAVLNARRPARWVASGLHSYMSGLVKVLGELTLLPIMQYIPALNEMECRLFGTLAPASGKNAWDNPTAGLA